MAFRWWADNGAGVPRKNHFRVVVRSNSIKDILHMFKNLFYFGEALQHSYETCFSLGSDSEIPINEATKRI